MVTNSRVEVVSTDGDFATNAGSFVEIPGVDLNFSLEEATHISALVKVSTFGEGCVLGLRVDGQDWEFARVVGSAPGCDIAMQGVMSLFLPAGYHGMNLLVKVLGGDPNSMFFEGPREWSPRKKKYTVWGGVRRSVEAPAVLMAIG